MSAVCQTTDNKHLLGLLLEMVEVHLPTFGLVKVIWHQAAAIEHKCGRI